ncbi:MAG: hypothetical protein JNL70_06500 [Saprospiraceae bacterium]|nr:hypothetical protein [Saprospiraceae bacterium]
MRSITLAFLSIATIVFFSQCKTDSTTKKASEILLSSVNKAHLLDSVAASKAIIRDDLAHFFDKITVADMSIQMKKPFSATTKRDEALSDYMGFLQRDVATFTTEESEFIVKAMNEAFNLCQKVSNKFFPDEILLIKSHGLAYGEDTYYTRENCIVIPKQALAKRDYDEFLRVMLHEISHIVTRTHPSVKAQLYALVGFKKIDNTLVIKDSLKNRILTNPDGIEQDWATTLTAADNKTVFALPLIYAKDARWSADNPEFFQNMGFNYFELAPSADAKSLVVLTRGDKQQSTLDTKGINELFQQSYNTQYIIHPDEIVADNFAILMLSEKKPTSLATYTEGGRELIRKMREVLSR